MAKDKPMPMPEKMPNMLHLDEDELPEIKDWKVGDKYTVMLEIEQTRASADKGFMGEDKKPSYHADFKILKVSMPDEDTPKEEAKESASVEEKEKSGKVAQAIRRKFLKK